MHMTSLPILSACITFLSILVINGEVTNPIGATKQFDDFVAAYGRNYRKGSDEYDQRRAIFTKHLTQVEKHNQRPDKSWTAAINEYSDWTHQEQAQLYGWRHVGTSSNGGNLKGSDLLFGQMQVSTGRLTEKVEWQGKLNSLDNVVNQGACGSCWAVATSVMLGARYESQLNVTRSFSMQELVSCTPNPQSCGGTGGCQGATVELAMAYVTENGLVTDEDEPYVGRDQPCKSSLLQSKQDSKSLIASWQTLPKNKAQPLMLALLDGPVAVSAAANGWMGYSAGVFDSCSRDTVINHAVVCTGYGRDVAVGKNYWNIRNSWGADWGDHGHIRLLRHESVKEDDEFCGTDADPGEGIECKPYPESVEVCGMCGVLYDSVVISFKKPMGTQKQLSQISTRRTFLHRAT